jgi:hypothetical protein
MLYLFIFLTLEQQVLATYYTYATFVYTFFSYRSTRVEARILFSNLNSLINNTIATIRFRNEKESRSYRKIDVYVYIIFIWLIFDIALIIIDNEITLLSVFCLLTSKSFHATVCSLHRTCCFFLCNKKSWFNNYEWIHSYGIDLNVFSLTIILFIYYIIYSACIYFFLKETKKFW